MTLRPSSLTGRTVTATNPRCPTVFSRVAGVAAGLFALLGAAYIAGMVRSPDSDWQVGVLFASPIFAVALLLACVALWTRRAPNNG
jgi:hypothetical protein